MALTSAERNALFDGLFVEFGEDYQSLGRIVRVLRAQFPAVDWTALLVNRARASAAFAASGLSVDWWASEVDRYSRLG